MSITTFSIQDYPIPQWSAQPQYTSYLQVIKGGTFIQNINIRQKPFSLIGRLQDLCDIYIDNPTVSRKHAILQYKNNDQYPYIYDLGGTHGTEVNHKKLPPKVYQKISPYDTIKFGVSSRMYIYRCPELEQKLQRSPEQNNDGTNFQEIINEKNRKLSQSELKQKYLEMLENDPCYAANNRSSSGKFMGESLKNNEGGINWGIQDQYQIYAYNNDNQFQIQPDVIRRLPGINQIQLNKLTDFQTNQRRYQQIEQSLNQLRNRQRKQYGLQQNLQDRKQRLQKKFVQAVQALQKSEEWIRVNMFGEESKKQLQKNMKIRDIDSFEDDQFLDRTLVNKTNTNKNQNKGTNSDMVTTEDFWKLDKQLRNYLKQLIKLEKQNNINNMNNNNKLAVIQQQQQQQQSHQLKQQQQIDQLDQFMKQNNNNLAKQTTEITNKQFQQLHQKIQNIKQQLISIVGEKQVINIEQEERGIKKQRNLSEEKRRKIQQKQNRRRMDQVLGNLEEIRRKNQEIDQEDVRIFQVFKQEAQLQDQLQQQQQNTNKRNRSNQIQQKLYQYQKPAPKKQGPSIKIQRDIDDSQDYIDLTYRF